MPPGLTFNNSTWCSHCVCVFCTDLRTNCNFYIIHRQLILYMYACMYIYIYIYICIYIHLPEVDSVYCTMRTESLLEENTEKILVHEEVFVLLGYDAASLGKSLSVFPRNVVVSSSRVETSNKILPEHFQKPIIFSIVCLTSHYYI